MNPRLHRPLAKIILSLCLFVLLSIAGVSAIATPALATDYSERILKGADFSGQDLRDSKFERADLTNSNFSHANLRGVSLFLAKLDGANLEGADLTFSIIDTARFKNANLTNAIFEDALAYNAKFDGAIVDGADFTGVYFRRSTEKLLCKAAKGTNPVTGRKTRDTLPCD
ncbi:MAG: pentapeptide repeat-containing protein [Hormoscilla sp. SP5CHS1]|nr:pentapeptide repeat-containing protein [Hormoscilla sp. SP12CHS1]MBC6453614.1 pentapeptide repeat-containing protein [Hormoscilla sp. SP5CHS1]